MQQLDVLIYAHPQLMLLQITQGNVILTGEANQEKGNNIQGGFKDPKSMY